METSPLPTSEMSSPSLETPKLSSKRKLIFGLLGGVIGLLSLTGAFAGYKYYEYVSTPVWSANDIVNFVRDGAIKSLQSHASTLDPSSPREQKTQVTYSMIGQGMLDTEMQARDAQATLDVTFDGYIEPRAESTAGAVFDTKTTIGVDVSLDGQIDAEQIKSKARLDLVLNTKSADGELVYFALESAKLNLSGSGEMYENIDSLDIESYITTLTQPLIGKWYKLDLKSGATDIVKTATEINPLVSMMVPSDPSQLKAIQETQNKNLQEGWIALKKALDTHTIVSGVARETSPIAFLSDRQVIYDATLDKAGIAALMVDITDIGRIYASEAPLVSQTDGKMTPEEREKLKSEWEENLENINLDLVVESDMKSNAQITLSKLTILGDTDALNLTKALQVSIDQKASDTITHAEFDMCKMSMSSQTGSVKDKSYCEITQSEMSQVRGRSENTSETNKDLAHSDRGAITWDQRLSPTIMSGSALISHTDTAERTSISGSLAYTLTTPKNTKTEFEQQLGIKNSFQLDFGEDDRGTLSINITGSDSQKTVDKKTIETPTESISIFEEIQKMVQTNLGSSGETTEISLRIDDASSMNNRDVKDVANPVELNAEDIESLKTYLDTLASQGALPEHADFCLAISAGGEGLSTSARTSIESCRIKYVRLSPSYYGAFISTNNGIRMDENSMKQFLEEFAQIDNLEKIQAFRLKHASMTDGTLYTLLTP